MLSNLRNFAKSKMAGVLVGIIIIPFVFWGMGNVFGGGSKNIVVVIDDEKYSIQQLNNFINRTAVKKVEVNETYIKPVK